MAKSPINVVASGVTPFIKTPMELASGEDDFPDSFKPRDYQIHRASSCSIVGTR